jgi:hypothetical protein
MRISKFLSAVCAAAFLTGSLAVRAQDTPDQAAARAALMQKMTELDAQQNQPTNSNPLASVVIAPSTGPEQVVQPAIAAPVVNPPPVIVVTPSGAQTVPQQQAPGSNQQAAVKPSAKPVKPRVAPVAKPPPAKPVKPTAAPVVKPLPAKSVKPPAAPVVKSPPAEPVKPPVKPVKPTAAPVVKPPPPANAGYAGKTLGLKPIDVPPPPVSAKKEAELQALLAKYMADQETPDEYQKARAAILAEP